MKKKPKKAKPIKLTARFKLTPSYLRDLQRRISFAQGSTPLDGVNVAWGETIDTEGRHQDTALLCRILFNNAEELIDLALAGLMEIE